MLFTEIIMVHMNTTSILRKGTSHAYMSRDEDLRFFVEPSDQKIPRSLRASTRQKKCRTLALLQGARLESSASNRIKGFTQNQSKS